MDLVEKYSILIKKNADKDPRKSINLIRFGLFLENMLTSKFPHKNTPDALKYLNKICLDDIRNPLAHPDKTVWVNIFAPCEILSALDLYPLSIEAFSSFMSGFKCEDFFIDRCENEGIAETLCSYHKTFIGASLYHMLDKPNFQVTTSIACDANINTFRYAANLYSNPHYEIDVPYEYSKEAEGYVVSQLKEMIALLEKSTHKKLDLDKLKEIIKTENETKHYIKKYINSLKYKYYPSTLTLQMYMLFPSHISIGTKDTYKFFKMLSEDIEKYPERKGKGIFWVHLIPFYHDVLRSYFNFNPNYQILGYDLILDYLEDMDYNHPLEAIAKKMINNIYNGPYQRKVDAVLKMVDTVNADGVINFCHFGCKQSSGGIMILKNALMKKGIPFLPLDGDAVDRRNSHSGQVKTRLEAFLEMLENLENKERNR